MIKRKNRGYWTLENCLFEAKKYKSVSEWKENSGSSYVRALKMGWRKRCVMHMPLLGSKHKRLIYVYEFPDKSVYVGLTYNPSIRMNDHLINPNKRNGSSVYKHILKTKLIPTYIEVSKFISIHKASELEISTIDIYNKLGFKILNKKTCWFFGW